MQNLRRASSDKISLRKTSARRETRARVRRCTSGTARSVATLLPNTLAALPVVETIWIADAHRDDGKRFVVRAGENLTAFLEL